MYSNANLFYTDEVKKTFTIIIQSSIFSIKGHYTFEPVTGSNV